MTVNGENFDLNTLTSGQNLIALIGHFRLTPQRVAVELNGKLIPRNAYEATSLSGADVVEIIHYVGGG